MVLAATADLLTGVLPALALVAAIPLAVWWWNRKTRTGTTQRMWITDRAPLGKGLWVTVVEVDDRRFLLGAAEHNVNLISELEPLPEDAIGADTGTTTTDPANGIAQGPRMGLMRRLQLMTVRSRPHPIKRPTRGQT